MNKAELYEAMQRASVLRLPFSEFSFAVERIKSPVDHSSICEKIDEKREIKNGKS